jgi:nucleotide sugar dehydrogenase
MKIGFIGQGWIGKHYSDDFENRGYDLVRYSLDEQYKHNDVHIPECDIVFIAVPTPTTPEGFDANTVRQVLAHVGQGKIAVIKSTILPGTTEMLQAEFSNIYVMHSPEFLTEKTAAYDAAHPNRNIVGIPKDSAEYVERARLVLSVLPKAPFETVMNSRDAEFVKYAGNCYLFTKVIYMNMLYDLVSNMGGDWKRIRDALIHDPRIGVSHTEPVHQSGRGAGGNCFIKDFEAFRKMYDAYTDDHTGSELIKTMAYKNIQLLVESGKDIALLEGVYGDLNKHREWKHVHDTLV